MHSILNSLKELLDKNDQMNKYIIMLAAAGSGFWSAQGAAIHTTLCLSMVLAKSAISPQSQMPSYGSHQFYKCSNTVQAADLSLLMGPTFSQWLGAHVPSYEGKPSLLMEEGPINSIRQSTAPFPPSATSLSDEGLREVLHISHKWVGSSLSAQEPFRTTLWLQQASSLPICISSAFHKSKHNHHQSQRKKVALFMECYFLTQISLCL